MDNLVGNIIVTVILKLSKMQIIPDKFAPCWPNPNSFQIINSVL